MPNINQLDAGNLTIRPSETGVEARAMTARRVGAFSNQLGGAEEMLARETERLASQTSRVGSETQQLGRETGELGDFRANLERDTGRRIGSAVTDIGDAGLKIAENQEINRGAAAWAGMVERKTQEWNDTAAKANPNDPTTAHTFMAGMENELQSFRNGFLTENGQKWAESHIDAFRLHMAEKAHADMATMAGIAAETNVRQTINSLSNTVHGDPSSLSFALAGLNSSIEGSISTSPNLKGPEGAKLRERLQQGGAESIVKSAAVGYIEKTGQVPPWATDPKFSQYINGAELTMLARAAKTQQKSDLLAQKQLDIYAKQQADLAVHTGMNKIMGDNVSIGPDGRPVINPRFSQDVLDVVKKNPGAPSGAPTARTMLDWMEHQQNVRDMPTRSDPDVKAGLMTGIFDPAKPTTEIDVLRAEADKKLSPQDSNVLRQMVKASDEAGTKTEAFKDTLSAAKAALTYSMPGMPGKDPKGMESYARFVQDFMPKYQAALRAGTLPPNALDMSDPKSMISQSLSQFRRTTKQLLDDRISELSSLNLTGEGKTVGASEVIDIPAGMSPTEALKTYGKGKTIRLPDGRTKVLQ